MAARFRRTTHPARHTAGWLMTRCARLRALETWAKAGSDTPLQPDLELHAMSCSVCGAMLFEVLRVRALCAKIPARELDAPTRDAMRFALTAEARRASERAAAAALAGPLAQRRWWPLVGLAGAVTIAAALWLLIGRAAPETAPTASRAVVELASGAVGAPARAAPDEIYRLASGVATFRVRKLSPIERFRVQAGDGTIEVRGTRFTARVTEQRLQEVTVDEGEVVVWLGDNLIADLRAGSRWERPARNDDRADAAPVAQAPRDSLGAAVTPTAAVPPASVPSGSPVSGRVSPANAGATAGGGTGSATPREAPDDSRFAHAWKLLNAGQAAEAAVELDALGQSGRLDSSRRVDVLYWSSQAHARAGHAAAAEARGRQLLREYPSSSRATDAALLVGQAARARGDLQEARYWLEKAVTSVHPAVRSRALADLKTLSAAPP